MTNNGHIHTNDDLLTASGIDIDDIIDGRYPLGLDVKLIMVIKNGKAHWATWDIVEKEVV
jgi:hypothetical protein